MGGTADAIDAARGAAAAAWFADLAASLDRLEVYGMAIVVVDAADGRILGSTSSATDLFGGPLPPALTDLLDDGSISRPDLGRLDRRVRTTRQTRDHGPAPGTLQGETSESWSDQLRIHRRGHAPQTLHLEVIVHHRPTVGASAAIVTIWPEDQRAEPPSAGDRQDLWAIYDDDLRMIAADPAFADLGIDPISQLGAVAWMYAHPDDIPGPQKLVAEVAAGRLRTARYSMRLRALSGRWLDTDIELRRLVTANSSCFVIIARYVNQARRAIPVGALTTSQLRAVDGLFEGLRVAQIAERDGVAVKTVRNHLAATYGRLDVTGQVELLRSYHRPERPQPPA